MNKMIIILQDIKQNNTFLKVRGGVFSLGDNTPFPLKRPRETLQIMIHYNQYALLQIYT